MTLIFSAQLHATKLANIVSRTFVASFLSRDVFSLDQV
jgi:hypothetical protein